MQHSTKTYRRASCWKIHPEVKHFSSVYIQSKIKKFIDVVKTETVKHLYYVSTDSISGVGNSQRKMLDMVILDFPIFRKYIIKQNSMI